MLARYSLTIEEMEQQYLDLELVAEEQYTAEIGGKGDFELTGGVDASGAAFTGFEGEGIWLLGLFSTYSSYPAPFFLGVVEAD